MWGAARTGRWQGPSRIIPPGRSCACPGPACQTPRGLWGLVNGHSATAVIWRVGGSDVQNHLKWRFAGMILLLKAVLVPNSPGPGQCIRQGASKHTRCAAAIAPSFAAIPREIVRLEMASSRPRHRLGLVRLIGMGYYEYM